MAEKNPTVEAFVNFLDGLDHDKQDELRVAIIENRLLASDDSMQMRQANLELSESFNKKESSPIGSERDGNREDHFSDANRIKNVASVAEKNPCHERGHHLMT